MLISAVFTAIPAQARLGETEAEMIKRWGKSIGRGTTSLGGNNSSKEAVPFLINLMFETEGDWHIFADVFEGKCVQIRYSKTGAWASEQVDHVLEVNAQGHSWKEIPMVINKTQRRWVREDGASAVLEGPKGLTVTSADYKRAEAAILAKAKALAAKKPNI
jgi:hypothetical protein